MLKTDIATFSAALAAALVWPGPGAIAQDLPTASTSAHDLPTLSNNEQGQEYLDSGVEQELIFRRALEQQSGAGQFGDVSPEDWAYQALDDLTRRYDCLKGYPDGTYRGERSLSRDELAAALNSCLQRVEQILAGVTSDHIRQEDWKQIQALQQEFSSSFVALKNRIDALESRIAALESYQFSTTTKFNGEVIFAFSDLAIEGESRALSRGTANGTELFGVTRNDDRRAVFGARGRLWTRTSFSGEDLLLLRLTISNLPVFDDANEFTGLANSNVLAATGEAVQTFNLGNTTTIFQTNNFTASYSLPLNDTIKAHVFGVGGIWSDFVPTLNPYFEDYDNGNGALTLFATNNPIYRIGGGSGFGLNFDLGFLESSTLSVGYLSGSAAQSNRGIFSGDYAMLVQTDFQINDDLALGLTYNHGYHPGGTAVFDMGGLGSQGVVGSALASVGASGSTVPQVSNAYGVEVAWQPSDSISLSGFFTYVDVISPAVFAGVHEVWTYGMGVAFPDLFTEGGLLGVFAGTQPYVAGFDSPSLTFRNDVLPRHLEIFYRYPLSEQISLTPGIIFLTSPNQIQDGASVFTLRATFDF
ncbi:MAG: iron uptake porin [Spirulina sp. SIO3F2]|nr:iron uptake porin [Spirulina sp. SIO3F2]